MNTTENNKIIAEFMGAKETVNVQIMYPIYEGKSEFKTKLIYHSDWNWLMEVVEKIESLNTSFDIDGNKCYCINDSFCNSQKESTKIESVYKVCIAFIEWYNEQN